MRSRSVAVSGRDEIGGTATVACEVRAAQVAEIGDRFETPVEVFVAQRWPLDRLGLDDRVERVVIEPGEQGVRIFDDRVDDLRVEVCPTA